MFVDARSVPAGAVLESDICIVGAGAAGITLARELANTPLRVLLLESGGLEFDGATQALYDGEVVGLPTYPLEEARARYFGGSTNLWGGWSRPLDERDFDARPWLPYSGWPITKSELTPYYERAQAACRLGPYAYAVDEWQRELAEAGRVGLPFNGEMLETYLWQIIPPSHLRFGEVYRAQLAAAANVDTYLGANAVDLETTENASVVTGICVAGLEGRGFTVKARAYVLAAGGIENPRLLLAASGTRGIGNEHDLVGRFFMDHPCLVSGRLHLFRPAPLYTQRNFRLGEAFMATALGFTRQVAERERLLNVVVRLIPKEEDWVVSMRRLRARRSGPAHPAFPTLHEGHGFAGAEAQPIWRDLGRLVANTHRIAGRLADKVLRRRRKAPLQVETHVIAEQAPNPDSRVTLAADCDRLGVPRARLDWRLGEADRHTVERAQELLAAEFERGRLGTLELDRDVWGALTSSYHHMGTTRMARSPREGVVDTACKVHGLDNLYVAGSSVFPTGGVSNPTLTLVALAIRLADHLKERLGRESTPALSPSR